MSGGYFNYVNYSAANEIRGQFQDAELNDLFDDLFVNDKFSGSTGYGLIGALDYYLDGDISEETYRDCVTRFKSKWFHRTPKNRIEFYQQKLQEAADKYKKELGDI